MNLKELREELEEACPVCYFAYGFKLNDEDHGYARRSFDDLFLHYSKLGVTEEILMTALYKSGFSALVCSQLKKVVFFKNYRQVDKFWGGDKIALQNGYSYDRKTKNTKYTEEYLNNLFDSLKL